MSKYAIQILNKELASLKDAIRFFKEGTSSLLDVEKAARKEAIKKWEAQATELKADIKKLK